MLSLFPLSPSAQTITPPLFRCPFAPGSAEVHALCEESAGALRDHWSAAIAAGTPLARVDVLGSTSTEEARRNPGLAQQRAAAVAALLVRLGFSAERMGVETSDFGEPVVLMDPFGQARCLFAPGSAAITPACTAALRGFAAMVGEYPTARRATLEIDANGFTDDREARSGLSTLAARRAEAVVQALRAQGLRTQTFNLRGHGPDGALRPTNRPDPRARVVSLVVVPPAAGL